MSIKAESNLTQESFDKFATYCSELIPGQTEHPQVKSLKSTLAEKDARAKEHLRRMEEISRMTATYYGPLRLGTSGGSAAGIDSTTAPPLPPRPPPPPPPSHPPEGDDDDDYDDA
ncbi:hypothetical protein PIB30_029057 [Stylosanthes scabra]|uniref:Uncharacterized protein n=1 Tax=Stylosanthes scabra TaxID=79078 RepID=A0ABU6QBS5_9FABA|nr:hypothetical protein [Stylosanthes scabra]